MISAPPRSPAPATSPAPLPAAPAGGPFSALQPYPELQSFLAALLLAGAILAVAAMWGNRLERSSIHQLTLALAHEKDPETEHIKGMDRMEHVKSQGMCLQRRVLQEQDLVSIYGSSELRKMIPDKANIFFKDYPSGFAVSHIGRAGATPLILLQKIAAADPGHGPRRLALTISLTWFTTTPPLRYYEGNFSAPQAMALACDARLSHELKRDLARRLLEYPTTLEKVPLLGSLLTLLAHDTPADRLLYRVLLPAAWAQDAIYRAQDHFEAVLGIITERNRWEPLPPRDESGLDWPTLLAEASAEARPLRDEPSTKNERQNDATYLDTMVNSPHWADLHLLLRTLRELKLDPLVLVMPPCGTHLQRHGISTQAVEEVSRRLHSLGEQYGVTVETFADHAYDASFLADRHDHLSVKGWMYFNQAIDRFFHRAHPDKG